MPKDPLTFPHGEHEECRALTELTAGHLPADGSLGRARRYRSRQQVWEPDDRSDRIYFLLRGEVAISAPNAGGGEVIVRSVEAGQPFGELCFCGGPTKVRRTTARAVVACEAVEIKLPDFIEYVRSDGDVLTSLIFTFCVRLGEAERLVEIFAYRRAEERLGRLLLHLAEAARRRQGSREDSGGGKVILQLTHDELARRAGMSRQHVTITLGKMRRAGLVEYGRGRPLVVDTQRLSDHLS
jgi:CRP/FNR family transcriptional regulator